MHKAKVCPSSSNFKCTLLARKVKLISRGRSLGQSADISLKTLQSLHIRPNTSFGLSAVGPHDATTSSSSLNNPWHHEPASTHAGLSATGRRLIRKSNWRDKGNFDWASKLRLTVGLHIIWSTDWPWPITWSKAFKQSLLCVFFSSVETKR